MRGIFEALFGITAGFPLMIIALLGYLGIIGLGLVSAVSVFSRRRVIALFMLILVGLALLLPFVELGPIGEYGGLVALLLGAFIIRVHLSLARSADHRAVDRPLVLLTAIALAAVSIPLAMFFLAPMQG